ncbi:hypothetical protein Tco_0204040 [Tanacetum coccineum]
MLSEPPKLLSGIEDSHHGPSDAMHNPPQPLKVSQKTLVSFLMKITPISIDFLTPSELVASIQVGKRSQDDDKKLCLVDDLKEVQVRIQVNLKGASSSLKSKDYYTYHKLKDKDSRPRAKTETFIKC